MQVSNAALDTGDGQTTTCQHLTFTLAQESYGVDVFRVQEIRGWEQVTRVPNAPVYVKGVINLRGAIVPIYDLRLRFDLPARPYTKETVVIVLRSKSEQSVGLVVDAVSGVLAVDNSAIAPMPEFGAGTPIEGIRRPVADDGRMVVILDVDDLLAE